MADTRQSIIERFARHVSSGKAEFYLKNGLDFVMGERDGVYVSDVESGQKLINCHCNGGVFNLGHRNPRIISALQNALETVDIGNHHLISELRAELAERLANISPGELNRVVFGVSGGETVDMAIKLARAHTRRSKIISCKGGYHGHTGLALATGDEQYRAPFGPNLEGFIQVTFGDIKALEAEIDRSTAAVIIETIPATLGIAIPPDDYFEDVRALCNRFDVVMIADEIQTGLGRCGAYWGIDTYNVIPDMIVTGKGLSGGIYPITALIYHDRLNPFLHNHPFIHVSTFGGAELGCAAALEVLNILEEPDFLPHVDHIAAIFEDGFAQLKARYPDILLEVRQRGMMMGLKMASELCGPLCTVGGIQAGIFTLYANNDTSVSQILPSLIINETQSHQVLSALDQVLTMLEGAMQ